MKSRCQPSSSVSGSSVATSSQTTTKKTASPKHLPGKYRHLPSGLFWRRIWRKHCGHVLQSPNVGPVLSSFSTSVHVDAAASVTLVRVGSCLCRSSSPDVFWWIVDRGELAECAQSVSGSYYTPLLLLLGHESKRTAHSYIHGAIFHNPVSTLSHLFNVMSQLWSFQSFQLQVVNWKQENANSPPPYTLVSWHKYLPVAVNEFWIFVEIKGLLFPSSQSMFMSC